VLNKISSAIEIGVQTRRNATRRESLGDMAHLGGEKERDEVRILLRPESSKESQFRAG
jgi:hypothetical protein